MHVGQDVLTWKGEGATKLKTNIILTASPKVAPFRRIPQGRVWSHDQTRDLHYWVRWVRQVGPAVADQSVTLQLVMVGSRHARYGAAAAGVAPG